MEYDASALGTRRPVVLGVLFVTLQNELTKKTYVLLYLYVNCDDDLMKNFVWCSVFRCENCLAWFVQRDLVIEMLASYHHRVVWFPIWSYLGNQPTQLVILLPCRTT